MNTDKHGNFVIPKADALKLLATFKENGKKRIHTIEGGGGFIMGCNMDLDDILDLIKDEKELVICSPSMSLGHCIVIWREGRGWLYLQTKKLPQKYVKVLESQK